MYVLVFSVDPAEETFYGGERIVLQAVELESQTKELVHWMIVWSQKIYFLRCDGSEEFSNLSVRDEVSYCCLNVTTS